MIDTILTVHRIWSHVLEHNEGSCHSDKGILDFLKTINGIWMVSAHSFRVIELFVHPFCIFYNRANTLVSANCLILTISDLVTIVSDIEEVAHRLTDPQSNPPRDKIHPSFPFLHISHSARLEFSTIATIFQLCHFYSPLQCIYSWSCCQHMHYVPHFRNTN